MIIKKESKGQMYDIIIDDEDYEKFCKYTWHINSHSNTKYCKTNIFIDGKWTKMRLHRLIMNLKNGDKKTIINHIDGNGLNNQKSNLEICNNLYNSQSINKKTRFGNIYIDNKYKKKYRARVTINKKLYEKRYYTNEEAEAYLAGLKEIAIKETIPFND